MKAGLYARVSTDEQNPENQLRELRDFARRRGYEPVVFIDKGLSGTLEADRRPGLSALMNAARRHEIKAVFVWDLSRFARSMKQLILALDQFRSWGVDFVSYQQGIDTVSAAGRLTFGIIAALAEFERALIVERVRAGMARARSEGKTFGRPRLPVTAADVLAASGSIRERAEALHVSKSFVARILKAQAGVPKGSAKTRYIVVGDR
jgi:DNA invertase Pin-like site-specific DNA recombinase